MGNKILLRDTSGNRLPKRAKANQTELVSTTDATLTVQTQTIPQTPVGGGAAGNPAGNNGYVQYNNGGAFGGNQSLFFDSTNCNTIVGSSCSSVYNTSTQSSIIGGHSNKIRNNSCQSAIIAGSHHEIDCSTCHSTIIGGWDSYLGYYSCHSSILGGKYHEIYGVCRSSIIGGCESSICYAGDSSILGGCNNEMCDSKGSTIIGGHDGTIRYNTCNSSIVAGAHHYIGQNLHNSAIVGGYRSCIMNNSCDSSIVASRYSCLNASCHSAIIGGTSLTLSETNDTVLVPNLQSVGGTVTFTNLPGSDPHVSGQLFISGMTLMVSAG